jgi:hypothetical protein
MDISELDHEALGDEGRYRCLFVVECLQHHSNYSLLDDRT